MTKVPSEESLVKTCPHTHAHYILRNKMDRSPLVSNGQTLEYGKEKTTDVTLYAKAGRRTWSHGVYGCLDPGFLHCCGKLLYANFCPCCFMGSLAEKAGLPYRMGCMGLASPALMRTRVRLHYGILPDDSLDICGCGGDCFVTSFALTAPCAALQLDDHLDIMRQGGLPMTGLPK